MILAGRFGRRTLTVLFALSASFAGAHLGCATTPKNEPPVGALDVPRDPARFADNPELLERITATAHGFFRFINERFSNAICQEMEDALASSPKVNLHGDAHLEQYAVTDLGRGLTDFDDAATGPAPLDLVRFGVSVSLAAKARGWTDDTPRLLARFLDGYRAALEDPQVSAPAPSVVARIEQGFTNDRSAYLEWVKSISAPVTVDEERELSEALQPYIKTMFAEQPKLTAGFFDIVDIGRLRMGIGSALDDKFLLRVQGTSTAPEDDVVLEAKEVRDLSGFSCVSTNSSQDAFRILVAQSRIAYRPYRFLGYIRLHDKTFWIHAWVDNYQEVKLGKTLRTPDEMSEVVYDVGVQLGRGHPSQIAAPLDLQLRQALRRQLDAHEADFLSTVAQLAREVEAAWKRFKAR